MSEAAKTVAICVVDDNAVVIDQLAALLERATLGEAVFFTDPLPALEWCLSKCPPLVLVDEAMPGLGGFEFMGRLRAGAGNRDAVMALLSTDASQPLHERALAAGASAVIAKPLFGQQVVGQLRGLVELTRNRFPDWEKTIAQATSLARRVVCRESEVVFPALRSCAAAYGFNPSRCDLLESAWSRLLALPLQEPAPREASTGGEEVKRQAALRTLALAERDRSARQARAGRPDASLWLAQMLLYGSEHWDGSGGPVGLRATDIPFPARFFHLINSYGLLRTGAGAGGGALAEDRALALVGAWSEAEFDPEMVRSLRQSARC